jgi:oligopeptide/dipeptide ABC transporter ATP-binding protein
MSTKILEVKNLKKHFTQARKQTLKAVNDVSFDIHQGETFGLVGESGCGKSTAGRTIIRLYDQTDGQVLFKGQNVHDMENKQLSQLRREMQMIFQDPYASLNPRMTVAEIIGEGMEINGLFKGKKRKERIHELLDTVGLSPDHASRFPHEFSGGQRQRIGIARALAMDPELIIADEPISALDVSVQAQVINLLQSLQQEHQLTYLFIAHDLAMVKHISDRIGVMYLGKMMEISTSEDLYANPKHPYTQSLLSAIPAPNPQIEKDRERIILEGEVPSPVDPPSGCVFRTRCPAAMDICAEQTPAWTEISPQHHVACHLYE